LSEIARPRFVALGVGTAMAALSQLVGFVLWRVTWGVQWYSGRHTCPEGMCMVWMYLGFLGSAPAFVTGAIAAGVTARRIARKSAAEIWRTSFIAGLVSFVATSIVGLGVAALAFGYWRL
jgi:hypothetical protein